MLFVYSECIVGGYLLLQSEETSGAAVGSTTAPSVTSTAPLAWCSSIPCISSLLMLVLAQPIIVNITNLMSPCLTALNTSVVYYTKYSSKLLKLLLR